MSKQKGGDFLEIMLIGASFLLAGIGAGRWMNKRRNMEKSLAGQRDAPQERRWKEIELEPGTDAELARIQKILDNIDHYDGTGAGQRKID